MRGDITKMQSNEPRSKASIFEKIKGKVGRFFFESNHDEEVNPHTVSEIKAISFYPATQSIKPRINLIVPSIEKEHVYGGISTALILFQELSEYFERSRIIVLDFGVSECSLKRYHKYSLVDNKNDSDAAHQVVSLARGESAKGEVKPIPLQLAVSETDVFVATIWYSAYMAQNIREWQRTNYASLPKSFTYLIQDYEPGFYPWSSQYMLAESTYKDKGETLALFNTDILQSYFHEKGITFYKEYSFSPVMNSVLQKERLRFLNQNKKKIIVVYGRPSTKRNAFCLIVDSLRHWYRVDSDAGNWKIISAGESHQEIKIGENLNIQSVGKLSIEEYASLLGEAAIGISFMVSPHPSYPPLEMAHYGLKVITNTYRDKDLSMMHSNIVSLDNIRFENVADELLRICRKIEENSSCGWDGVSYMDEYLSKGSQFRFIKEVVSELSKTIKSRRD